MEKKTTQKQDRQQLLDIVQKWKDLKNASAEEMKAQGNWNCYLLDLGASSVLEHIILPEIKKVYGEA